MSCPITVQLLEVDSLEEWKGHARGLIRREISPDQVLWKTHYSPGDLFAQGKSEISSGGEPVFTVPRAFVGLAGSVILHRSDERFSMLYELLFRIHRAPHIMQDAADPLIRRLNHMAKAVGRDIHKMRAFVRFREMDGRYVAWFEPEHHIVRANAGFFRRRFASMQWSILTPDLCIHWNGSQLTESPGAERTDAPAGDPIEAIWRSYYASIFNPSRLKVKAMLKEMPKRYWKNMPEAELIPDLIKAAGNR